MSGIDYGAQKDTLVREKGKTRNNWPPSSGSDGRIQTPTAAKRKSKVTVYAEKIDQRNHWSMNYEGGLSKQEKDKRGRVANQ